MNVRAIRFRAEQEGKRLILQVEAYTEKSSAYYGESRAEYVWRDAAVEDFLDVVPLLSRVNDVPNS